MLTCKKLEQRDVFDTVKLLKASFTGIYEILDLL